MPILSPPLYFSFTALGAVGNPTGVQSDPSHVAHITCTNLPNFKPQLSPSTIDASTVFRPLVSWVQTATPKSCCRNGIARIFQFLYGVLRSNDCLPQTAQSVNTLWTVLPEVSYLTASLLSAAPSKSWKTFNHSHNQILLEEEISWLVPGNLRPSTPL